MSHLIVRLGDNSLPAACLKEVVVELARRLVVVGARECNGGTVAAGLDAAGLDERVVGDAEVVGGRLVAEDHDASAPALEDPDRQQRSDGREIKSWPLYARCSAYVFPSTTTPEAEVSKSMAQPSGPPSYSPRRLKSLLTIFDVPSTLPRMMSVVPSAHMQQWNP